MSPVQGHVKSASISAEAGNSGSVAAASGNATVYGGTGVLSAHPASAGPTSDDRARCDDR